MTVIMVNITAMLILLAIILETLAIYSIRKVQWLSQTQTGYIGNPIILYKAWKIIHKIDSIILLLAIVMFFFLTIVFKNFSLICLVGIIAAGILWWESGQTRNKKEIK